jgi:hypothetical protein
MLFGDRHQKTGAGWRNQGRFAGGLMAPPLGTGRALEIEQRSTKWGQRWSWRIGDVPSVAFTVATTIEPTTVPTWPETGLVPPLSPLPTLCAHRRNCSQQRSLTGLWPVLSLLIRPFHQPSPQAQSSAHSNPAALILSLLMTRVALICGADAVASRQPRSSSKRHIATHSDTHTRQC